MNTPQKSFNKINIIQNYIWDEATLKIAQKYINVQLFMKLILPNVLQF